MSPARLSCHLAHSYGHYSVYRLCSMAWGYVACVARLSYSNSALHCALRPARLATDYFTRPSPTCPFTPPPPQPSPNHNTVASSLSSRTGDGSLNFLGLGHTSVKAVSKTILKIFFDPKNKILYPSPIPHHHPLPQPSFWVTKIFDFC